MFQVLFLIPLADDDGDRFGVFHMIRWEAYLSEQFASVGLLPQMFAHGFAAMLNESSMEEVSVYLVNVESLHEGARILAVLRFAQAYFGRAWILAQHVPLRH